MRIDSNSTQGRGKWKKDRADRGVILRGHVWYVRYQDPLKGKMRWEAVGPSKATALKVYKKRQTEISEGRFFPELARKNVTFDEIVGDALKATENHHKLKYRGMRRFRDRRYDTLLKWFPSRLASTITPQEIQAKLDEHAKSGSTFNQYRVAVSHAYRIAMDNKKVIENPARLVKLQKLNNERIRYLNQYTPAPTYDDALKPLKDEESRLRAVMRKRFPEREPEFDLALNTGMRFSEQYGLRWKHVDWERKLVTIELAKSGKNERVPLNRAALSALVRLRDRLGPDEAEASEKLVCGGSEWEHREWWRAVKEEAGVKDFRWHDLRHTFASRLVMADVNILTVKDLLRHATLTMTLRYAHLAPSHLHEAVEKLGVAASVATLPQASENAARTIN